MLRKNPKELIYFLQITKLIEIEFQYEEQQIMKKFILFILFVKFSIFKFTNI